MGCSVRKPTNSINIVSKNKTNQDKEKFTKGYFSNFVLNENNEIVIIEQSHSKIKRDSTKLTDFEKKKEFLKIGKNQSNIENINKNIGSKENEELKEENNENKNNVKSLDYDNYFPKIEIIYDEKSINSKNNAVGAKLDTDINKLSYKNLNLNSSRSFITSSIPSLNLKKLTKDNIFTKLKDSDITNIIEFAVDVTKLNQIKLYFAKYLKEKLDKAAKSKYRASLVIPPNTLVFTTKKNLSYQNVNKAKDEIPKNSKVNFNVLINKPLFYIFKKIFKQVTNQKQNLKTIIFNSNKSIFREYSSIYFSCDKLKMIIDSAINSKKFLIKKANKLSYLILDKSNNNIENSHLREKKSKSLAKCPHFVKDNNMNLKKISKSPNSNDYSIIKNNPLNDLINEESNSPKITKRITLSDNHDFSILKDISEDE